MTPFEGAVIISNLVVFIPLIIGMGSILVWHIILASKNTTTIEFHDKFTATKKNAYFRWPYDFGSCENLKLFFGRHYIHWFFPIPPEYLSDGINYPTAFEFSNFTLYRGEPPRENNDEEIFEVYRNIAELSVTIKNCNICGDPYFWETPLPLPNVTGKILVKVLEYCKYHIEHPTLDEDWISFPIPWDIEFCKVNEETLVQLADAANYLDIKSLLDLTTNALSKMRKDQNVQNTRLAY